MSTVLGPPLTVPVTGQEGAGWRRARVSCAELRRGDPRAGLWGMDVQLPAQEHSIQSRVQGRNPAEAGRGGTQGAGCCRPDSVGTGGEQGARLGVPSQPVGSSGQRNDKVRFILQGTTLDQL